MHKMVKLALPNNIYKGKIKTCVHKLKQLIQNEESKTKPQIQYFLYRHETTTYIDMIYNINLQNIRTNYKSL